MNEALLHEEIADWRGPLQSVQVRLRQMMYKDIDKFMESAQQIVIAAEKSDWSKVAIEREVARWSQDLNRVYASFKNSTDDFNALVKSMGIPTRRHSGKGKPLKKAGKMDWSKIPQARLKKEIKDQVKRLSGGIHSMADDGAFMLRQIDRILKYKKPKDETIIDEIGALYQDFVDFRNAFGSKIWGPYKGLLGRLNAVADKIVTKYGTSYGKAMKQRPMKTMPAVPQFAHSSLPIDCPELREAIERDKMRASRAVLGESFEGAQSIIEDIEQELLGEPMSEEVSVSDLLEYFEDFDGLIWEEESLSETNGVNRQHSMSEENLEEMSQVVQTIFQQFGGGRAMMMLGGKAIAMGPNTLSIKWPNRKRSKGNYVEITYVPGKDLYDMEFFNVSGSDGKSVKKYKGIYGDQLKEIFEKQTGWYLSI